MVFSSENILFVNVSTDLVNEYLKLVNDKEIQSLVSTKFKDITLEDELKWINYKLENKEYVYSMIEKGTNKFIGNVELMDYDGESAELGISIVKDMQNKHYGTEAMKEVLKYAFEVLKLKYVNAVIFSNNIRSLWCAKKLGFYEYKIVPNVKVVDEVSVDDVYLKVDENGFKR